MTLPAGGLKATFTSSYIHTVIIYVTLILFCVTVYGTSPKLGSPSVVWEHLTAMQHANPASGNRDGSYMTILSANGLMFGLIQVRTSCLHAVPKLGFSAHMYCMLVCTWRVPESEPEDDTRLAAR